jgi:hypothetical protein
MFQVNFKKEIKPNYVLLIFRVENNVVQEVMDVNIAT